MLCKFNHYVYESVQRYNCGIGFRAQILDCCCRGRFTFVFLYFFRKEMWVLVHWVESNQTSIIDERMVEDKSLLDNPRKTGMVKYGDPKKKAPKHGWKAYLAKVVAKSCKSQF